MTDKSLDDRLIVLGVLTGKAVGNDGAYGRGLVAKKEREAIDARALHLVIGNSAAAIAEGINLLVDVRVSKRKPHHPALRAVEARSGYGGANVDAGAILEPGQKLGGAVDDIGFCKERVPIQVLLKGMLKLEVRNIVAPGIIVQHAVKADGGLREQPRIHRQIGLKRARRADADNLQPRVPIFGQPGGEVDVDKSVKLRHDNVDIVSADACGQHRDPLALIRSRGTNELPIGVFTLNGVKKGFHGTDAARISDKDDF